MVWSYSSSTDRVGASFAGVLFVTSVLIATKLTLSFVHYSNFMFFIIIIISFETTISPPHKALSLHTQVSFSPTQHYQCPPPRPGASPTTRCSSSLWWPPTPLSQIVAGERQQLPRTVAEGGGGHADGDKRRRAGLLVPGGELQSGHPEKTGWTCPACWKLLEEVH